MIVLIIQTGILYYQKNQIPALPVPDPKTVTAIRRFINENSAENLISKEVKLPVDSVLLVKFDPNHTTTETWKSLGLSGKQVSVINNYISHGGRFRKKSDFKKMYCISESEYALLEPYILLPDSLDAKTQDFQKKKAGIVPVDLYKADSSALISLRGIGPVLASRIVKYRDKLGGFYRIEQLKEVWGITDTLFQSVFPQVLLSDTIPFRFIHLNTDSFDVMAAHPYLKGKIAGLICNYRKQHKSFAAIEELRQLPLITEENFLKLVPYITID